MTSAPNMLGQSEAFLDLLEKTSQLAKINRPILILGERGSGKELVAQRLHYLSPRWEAPFVALNCGAFAPDLLSSELFGHEKGAYTGASQARQGFFETAATGTLFLDEIANSPMRFQEQILRVLETGQFRRLGSNEERETHSRVLAATNANLESLVDDGTFRADLLDRLAFAVISVPPLRKRREDIIPLALHFAHAIWQEMDEPSSVELSPHVVEQLLDHDWPGNIRELRNVVQRAAFLQVGRPIEEIDLHPFPWHGSTSPKTNDSHSATRVEPDTRPGQPTPLTSNEPFQYHPDYPLQLAVETTQINYVKQALQATGYHQHKAATWLGLSYNQFRSLYRKHKDVLTHPDTT